MQVLTVMGTLYDAAELPKTWLSRIIGIGIMPNMDKPLRDWIESDIANLVNAGRTEGRSLEFKQELWDNGDRGSKDFLRDVCSMANSEGGLLLVGIAERRDALGKPTGEPDIEAPLGIECENPEQVLLGCEAKVLDGIDPRLTVESHSINLQSGRKVLAFRLPNSLEKPHRVFHQGRTWFPARREWRIYELNASEIRDMVMKTTSRLDEARRTSRIHLPVRASLRLSRSDRRRNPRIH